MADTAQKFGNKVVRTTCLQSSEAENRIFPVTLKPMLFTGDPLWSAMHLIAALR